MRPTAYLQSPARDLEKSKAFYSRLGFEALTFPDRKATLFTDGRVTIELNPSSFARTGLKLLPDAWQGRWAGIGRLSKVLDGEGGKVVADPNGIRVYFSSEADSMRLPELSEPFGRLGHFAGLSIEVSDFDQSARWWETLGYRASQGGIDQGWLTMSSGNGVDVSLLALNSCPHLFPQPGLTYFNSGKNLEIIKKIREARIPISEEITCFNDQGKADNVIIHDPGFSGFFIFND